VSFDRTRAMQRHSLHCVTARYLFSAKEKFSDCFFICLWLTFFRFSISNFLSVKTATAAARLSSNYQEYLNTQQQQAGKQHHGESATASTTEAGHTDPALSPLPSTSLLGYFDACEYDPSHALYNNSMSLEGRILSDFDPTYDRSTYPNASADDKSIVTVSTRAPPIPVRSTKSSKALLSSTVSSKQQREKTDPLALPDLSLSDFSYTNSKPWPSSLQEFQIGDRVDAVDYKGNWYPGSIIDICMLTEKDIKTHNLVRFTRDFMRREVGAGTGAAGAGSLAPGVASAGGKELATPGLHCRVHFDGFKGNWDEWYDATDYDRGTYYIV
jgi:hypothetical protein